LEYKNKNIYNIYKIIWGMTKVINTYQCSVRYFVDLAGRMYQYTTGRWLLDLETCWSDGIIMWWLSNVWVHLSVFICYSDLVHWYKQGKPP